MKYQIIYSPEAIEDIEKLKKTGNKAIMKKLKALI